LGRLSGGSSSSSIGIIKKKKKDTYKSLHIEYELLLCFSKLKSKDWNDGSSSPPLFIAGDGHALQADAGSWLVG